MPILVLILLIAVFAYLYFAKRGSTLTPDCRWRMDRTIAPDAWRCASCGAQTRGKAPRACLRPPQH